MPRWLLVFFMNINTLLQQTFTLCNKLAKKIQPQLGLKLDNAFAFMEPWPARLLDRRFCGSHETCLLQIGLFNKNSGTRS